MALMNLTIQHSARPYIGGWGVGMGEDACDGLIIRMRPRRIIRNTYPFAQPPSPHRILDWYILGLIEALALPCILEVKLSSINRNIFMRVHPAKLRVQV